MVGVTVSEGRIVGLVGAILATIGGVLLLVDAIPGSRSIAVEDLLQLALIIGLVVIGFLAAGLMATARYGGGGLLGIVGGAATLIVPGGSFSAGILMVLGGVLGIVAGAIRTPMDRGPHSSRGD